jgi:3-oxoacyl-[acyl-carrier protein] reductase
MYRPFAIQKMKLQGKVAVITGGGTGMGRAICEIFAQEGAKVIVNYNESREASEEVAKATGGEAYQASVADDGQVRGMMRHVEEKWGRLDILVNNAGWTKRTPHHLLEDLTEEIWDHTLNTNLRGTFYCSRAAAPLLRRQKGASIINVSSVAPYAGDGSTIVYAASKAGVLSMTKSFARVMAPDVRVNCIAPGLVQTRFAGWPPETFTAGAEKAPLKRITTPEEIGKAALFLAADATSMTGETIRVDSGVLALRHA